VRSTFKKAHLAPLGKTCFVKECQCVFLKYIRRMFLNQANLNPNQTQAPSTEFQEVTAVLPGGTVTVKSGRKTEQGC
jgi:hypothetical protein